MARSIRPTTRRQAAFLIFVVAVAALAIIGLATRSPGGEPYAYYGDGHAVVVIDGSSRRNLQLISQGANFTAPGGVGLTWQSDDGWTLNLYGPYDFDPRTATPAPARAVAIPKPSEGPIVAQGNLQTSVEPRRWAGFDSRACSIIYVEVTSMRIGGSLECRGLVWYDQSSVERVGPVDTPPFDLDVEFEATGDGSVRAPP